MYTAHQLYTAICNDMGGCKLETPGAALESSVALRKLEWQLPFHKLDTFHFQFNNGYLAAATPLPSLVNQGSLTSAKWNRSLWQAMLT